MRIFKPEFAVFNICRNIAQRILINGNGYRSPYIRICYRSYRNISGTERLRCENPILADANDVRIAAELGKALHSGTG